MAIKKPLVLASGQIQELQSGDDIDPKLRVSSNDTSPDYLGLKIVGDRGIRIEILQPGAAEEVEIGLDDINALYFAGVSANDNNPGYLEDKIVAGSNITITKNNAGADETLTIAATGGSSAPDIHPFLLMGA
jgi:hypothetical protein